MTEDWTSKRVLCCFRCGPVHPDDVKPAAEDEDVMIHDASMSLQVARRIGKPEGGICAQEVCWQEVVPMESGR